MARSEYTLATSAKSGNDQRSKSGGSGGRSLGGASTGFSSAGPASASVRRGDGRIGTVRQPAGERGLRGCFATAQWMPRSTEGWKRRRASVRGGHRARSCVARDGSVTTSTRPRCEASTSRVKSLTSETRQRMKRQGGSCVKTSSERTSQNTLARPSRLARTTEATARSCT
ncbi:MAG: hypothetical protein IPN17_25770 [Deltaproteobacteria bacterium]|nr:hypothetical protein [Deltaproteobacteria bacterium]